VTSGPQPKGHTGVRGKVVAAQTRGTDAYDRGCLWIENQDQAVGNLG
jgi:hypothetical protein